jgi:hypothetical protein
VGNDDDEAVLLAKRSANDWISFLAFFPPNRMAGKWKKSSGQKI